MSSAPAADAYHQLIDHERAAATLLELLPVPGGSGEESVIAEGVRQRLAELPGISFASDNAHEQSPFGGERGNLVATLPGAGAAAAEPTLMFSSHLDTVPLCVGCEPRQDGRRIVAVGDTALGADNRSGCAALITLARTLAAADSRPPIVLVFFVQEEVGTIGARYLDTTLLGNPAMAVNVDGGDPSRVHIGAIGASRWQADIHGIAAHAGMHPADGVSAAAIFALAVADLVKGGWHGAVDQPGGCGTANIGPVQGGTATNVVMDAMTVRGECRSHDAAFLRVLTDAYANAFAAAAAAVTTAAGDVGSVSFNAVDSYPSFSISRDRPVAQRISRVLEQCGLPPQLGVVNGGLDANFLNAKHGIETVTIGAGAHSPHTVDEYLDLDEYAAGCAVLVAFALSSD
jgi:tripeptide aminopeptidase